MRIAEVKTVDSPENKIIAITSEDKPEISDDLQKKWQRILDLAAKIIGVPSGLITRLSEKQLEVFLTSKTDGNIFEQNIKLELGLGWYCENVTGTREALVLPNALESDKWKENNPSIPFNMISYMGIPILWPDGEVFGTFCMLDNKENNYSETFLDLLTSLKEIIQNDLKSIVQYSKAQSDLFNKEVEIKEVHHRVKNHFNLLISTLSLQSLLGSGSKNINSVIADIQSRISTISLIHDKLYRSMNMESISLGDYLTELGKHIIEIFENKKVVFNCDCDEITVASNISVPCGLILNELITNSLKHAFANIDSPSISLSLIKMNGNNLEFIYKDNGPGLPDNFKIESTDSLGLILIRQSVLQMGGTFKTSNDNGFTFRMTIEI